MLLSACAVVQLGYQSPYQTYKGSRVLELKSINQHHLFPHLRCSAARPDIFIFITKAPRQEPTQQRWKSGPSTRSTPWKATPSRARSSSGVKRSGALEAATTTRSVWERPCKMPTGALLWYLSPRTIQSKDTCATSASRTGTAMSSWTNSVPTTIWIRWLELSWRQSDKMGALEEFYSCVTDFLSRFGLRARSFNLTRLDSPEMLSTFIVD